MVWENFVKFGAHFRAPKLQNAYLNIDCSLKNSCHLVISLKNDWLKSCNCHVGAAVFIGRFGMCSYVNLLSSTWRSAVHIMTDEAQLCCLPLVKFFKICTPFKKRGGQVICATVSTYGWLTCCWTALSQSLCSDVLRYTAATILGVVIVMPKVLLNATCGN